MAETARDPAYTKERFMSTLRRKLTQTSRPFGLKMTISEKERGATRQSQPHGMTYEYT
jgi:hypothetical protein